MKRIVLWIEELMKTSFLWVCDLCSSLSYPSAVPSSPCFLSPHLAASHSARLISFSSPPLPAALCEPAQTYSCTEQRRAAASRLPGPAWAGICFCPLPCPGPGALRRLQMSEGLLNLSRNGQLNGQLKDLLNWLEREMWWCILQCLRKWLKISCSIYATASPALGACQTPQFWNTAQRSHSPHQLLRTERTFPILALWEWLEPPNYSSAMTKISAHRCQVSQAFKFFMSCGLDYSCFIIFQIHIMILCPINSLGG